MASAIIGFFLSVPYALMEMVIMRECGRFSVSRMLSVASLNTQLAGTVAGYPAGRLLQLTGFEAAPAVERTEDEMKYLHQHLFWRVDKLKTDAALLPHEGEELWIRIPDDKLYLVER